MLENITFFTQKRAASFDWTHENRNAVRFASLDLLDCNPSPNEPLRSHELRSRHIHRVRQLHRVHHLDSDKRSETYRDGSQTGNMGPARRDRGVISAGKHGKVRGNWVLRRVGGETKGFQGTKWGKKEEYLQFSGKDEACLETVRRWVIFRCSMRQHDPHNALGQIWILKDQNSSIFPFIVLK